MDSATRGEDNAGFRLGRHLALIYLQRRRRRREKERESERERERGRALLSVNGCANGFPGARVRRGGTDWYSDVDKSSHRSEVP